MNVTVLLLFYVLVFQLQGMWNLSSPTRDQTCTPSTGLPGKSLLFSFLIALYILPSHLTTFSKKPHLTAPLEIATTTLLYPSPSFSIAIIHNYNRLCNLLIMSVVCLFLLEHKLSKGGNIYWFYSLTQLSQEPKTVLGI